MSLVLAAYKPTKPYFACYTRAYLFYYKVSSGICATIWTYDDSKSDRFKKLTSEEFELISTGSTGCRWDLSEV